MGKALYAENENIPESMLLGNLLFLNLGDMSIPESDFKYIFRKNNIPEEYVRTISTADAFRRATSSVKNRNISYLQNGDLIKGRVEIDEIVTDKYCIKRILGVKVINANNEDIAYESHAELYYNRSNETIATTHLPNALSSDASIELDKIIREIEENYEQWSIYHTKDTVRNTINRIIQDTHPISLMSTGLCKFIPVTNRYTLYNLKKALHELNDYIIGPSPNVIEIIPVIDTEEQRSSVQNNFENEMTKELLGFIGDLNAVLANKTKLSTKTVLSFAKKYKDYYNKIKDYESILGICLENINEKIRESFSLIEEVNQQSA